MPMRTPRLGASLRWPLLLLLLLGLADALRYSRAPRVINVRVRRAYRNIEAEVAALRDIGAPSKALVRLRDKLTTSLTRDADVRWAEAALDLLRDQSAAQGSGGGLAPVPCSDLRRPGRRVAVVTSAALPWMTGTSVNPLLRAAHCALKGLPVNLVMPWLVPEQQPLLFPRGLVFETPDEQEAWIRGWLHRAGFDDAVMTERLTLRWYPAIYEEFLGAIIQRSLVDVTQVVPKEERDVAILDEPEHINWFHHGEAWNRAYSHVVGVLHTNYKYYAEFEERDEDAGNGAGGIPPATRAKIMGTLNDLVIRGHVDVTIKLSATLDDVPGHCLSCNVHGVRRDFLDIGAEAAALEDDERARSFGGGAYLLGKCLWTKGYRELLDQMERAQAAAGGGGGDPVHVDTYGSGRDETQIREAAARLSSVTMHPGIDHASEVIRPYRVFVNPSTSEVLCTATAEALAMGKKVVIPDHPSNQFFRQFANAILYSERTDLLPTVADALRTPPLPLSAKEQYLLSWEAAIERLFDAALLEGGTPTPSSNPLAQAAYVAHYALGVEVGPLDLDGYFRTNSGATPRSALPGGGLLP